LNISVTAGPFRNLWLFYGTV